MHDSQIDPSLLFFLNFMNALHFLGRWDDILRNFGGSNGEACKFE